MLRGFGSLLLQLLAKVRDHGVVCRSESCCLVAFSCQKENGGALFIGLFGSVSRLGLVVIMFGLKACCVGFDLLNVCR